MEVVGENERRILVLMEMGRYRFNFLLPSLAKRRQGRWEQERKKWERRILDLMERPNKFLSILILFFNEFRLTAIII